MAHALNTRASDPQKPYGDVIYADPGYQSDGKKRYPIDTADHVRAAWSYINQRGNAGKYSPEQLKRIKARIMVAAKKHGITIENGGRSLDLSAYFERSYFEEGAHPRGEKGSTTGGQFVAKNVGKVANSAKTAVHKAPRRRPSAHQAKKASAKPTPKVPFEKLTFRRGLGVNRGPGDDRVRQLQRELDRLGIRSKDGRRLDVDGRFGPKTEEALKEYQRRLGMKPTGELTGAQLNEMVRTRELTDKKGAGKDKNCTCRSGSGFCDQSCGVPSEFRDLGMCTRAFHFRAAESIRTSGGRTLEGYAAVFGKAARISDMKGEFEERIIPGAFTRSLRQRQPVLQYEHGKDPRVGTVPIGAIEEVREDSKGLFVRATLFDNPVVEPVRQAIAGGAIKGMSFRFSVPKGGDAWTRSFGGVDQREVRDADVFELGPVVHPAYDATSVGVRSLLAGLSAEEVRLLVHELREHLGLAVDLVGQSFARSGDGSSLIAPEAAHKRHQQLRAKGILP